MENDVLVDIPDEDLPKLLEIYEKHAIKVPIVLSAIKTAIKWKKSEKYKNFITLMSPNNSWKEDGTLIYLVEVIWFFIAY